MKILPFHSTRKILNVWVKVQIHLHILARKQLHCRRFGRTVSHELRGDALDGARRRSDFFITLPRERYVYIYYIYIVCFSFPRECNDKYMYTNTTSCSSRSLTYTARQKRLLWSFYIRVSVIYQCFHLLRDTPWIIKNHKKKKISDEIGL